MNPRNWISLVIFIVVCLGIGGLGAMATTPEIDGWYRTIEKPTWNPPDWIFGPVWTTLYILMAIAGWRVWTMPDTKRTLPMSLFAIQLLLNLTWSFIFFAMHKPGWAFVEIVVLWLAITATMITFFQRSKLAGALFIPYWAWVSFASVLNFTIWRMNM